MKSTIESLMRKQNDFFFANSIKRMEQCDVLGQELNDPSMTKTNLIKFLIKYKKKFDLFFFPTFEQYCRFKLLIVGLECSRLFNSQKGGSAIDRWGNKIENQFVHSFIHSFMNESTMSSVQFNIVHSYIHLSGDWRL